MNSSRRWVKRRHLSGARVVVLAGEGESFCAGLDLAVLREMGSMSSEQHRVEAERVARMFRVLWECDVPTIAMVQGAAVAGGTGLATMCDFTVAAPEAKFGYTEVRIGFVPALVSAYLALQVGDKVARGLMLSGRLFGADEALRLGLVNELVPTAELRQTGWRRLTAELASEFSGKLAGDEEGLLRAAKGGGVGRCAGVGHGRECRVAGDRGLQGRRRELC